MATPAAYEITRREGWGGLHVQTYIYSDFTNLIISKEEQDESSLLIKPDLPIRPTIPRPLEHYFYNICGWRTETIIQSIQEKPLIQSSIWFSKQT